MLHRFVRVVRPTSQGQILDARLTSRSVRDEVVKLEESSLGTPTICADESALAAITFPDKATDVRRHSPRVGDGGDGGTRRVGLCQSSPFELIDEHRQGSFDNRRWITGRQGVAQQVLRPAEILVSLSTHRDLDQVSFRRERHDLGPR